ncbi:uncharacterized protein [Macrobrachium rosenbergii]|uniref:uncharacterized protein isoform X2 n=1 Tax=Macrobrachium rosenbergii TaxID=79674 RepID=UPI0034D4CEE1
MWKGKMTQEEEDLEELSSLEIREDHGAEDSDVTPINTPPISPPILYVKKYPPVKPPEDDEMQTFQRFTKREDYDCRSESSLSWGDDEFEGEATKQVSILFDQVDYLLYGEKKLPPSLLPSPEPLSPDVVDSPLHSEVLSSPLSDTSPLAIPSKDEDNIKENSGNPDSPYGVSIEVNDEDENQSSENIFSFGKFLGSNTNPSSDHMVVSEPSADLKQECRSWVNRFPHFRARGHSVDPVKVKNLEETLLSDCLPQEEEVIARDGNFDNLLPLVAYTSAYQVKTPRKDNLKQSAPSSRVCSGSNDPEVLKEQVLIALFEQLWEKVTKIIDPLLHQYAKYIIEQSVQYLSISREPSTRGSRLSANTLPQCVSGEVRKSDKFLSPMNSVDKSFNGTRNLMSSRPISGIRRPSSAVQRLPSSVSIPNIHPQEELHELLQVSTKPLQNGESRTRSYPPSTTQTRECSASSRMSQLSLPLVNTPRDSNRPVSSKSTSRHLAPVNTKGSTSLAEQRPASTSSYNTRMRIQERFQHLNRQYTIQELGTDNLGSESEEGMQEHHSPVWSRHIPFLPPITDSTAVSAKVQQFPPITRDDRMLTVKGTVMSASHRLDTNTRSSKTWGIPITETREGTIRQDFIDKK